MGIARALGLAISVAAAACGGETSRLPTDAIASQQCAYEIVQPDNSAATIDFIHWLKPQEEQLFGRDDVAYSGDVYIADLNNDQTNELLFAWHEGSGWYLNAMVFRGAADKWTMVEHPLDEQFASSHEYSDPLGGGPQLIARLCGKTVFNFMGGNAPTSYPDTWIWEGNTARRVCSAPWLTRHQRAAADLVNRGMLDEARVLLAGVRQGCEKESPGEVRAIDDDIARIDASTGAASAANYDFSWVINALKTDPTQQLMLDPRFSAMLVTIVPDVQLDGESFRGAVKKSARLTDDPKIYDNRYVVIGGCEPHNCSNRGFVWIDTLAKRGIAMTGGLLASKTMSAAEIPAVFWTHTQDTADPWHPGKVEFIDAAGKRTTVTPP
jgi:hypothetical protein